jgi:hypothetical protein
MRRIMYLFLPRWPIDQLRLSQRKGSAALADETLFATVLDIAERRLPAAVNPAASAATGFRLAVARRLPGVRGTNPGWLTRA